MTRDDRWIPRAIIGFFLCLVCLQMAFVVIAVRSFPGTVTDTPYVTGLDYNTVLARQKAEQALGWTVTTRFQDQGSLHGRLMVTGIGPDGQPLPGMAVEGQAERMTRAAQIVPVSATEIGPGAIEVPIRVPIAGRWFVRLAVRSGGSAVHQIVEVDIAP